MIKRIVKMTFDTNKVNDFLEVYKTNWQFIKGFEGCNHVELLQCEQAPNIFFTYSLWDSQEALDKYRNSDLFAEIWGKTKQLFSDKPQAWSVNEVKF